MKPLSLYQERDTVIHKISAISKIIYIFAAIFIPIILGSKLAGAIAILISIAILIKGRVLKKVIPLIAFIAVVLLSVILIQGLFRHGNKTVVLALGTIKFYKEGLYFAFGVCIRVINILLSFCVLILTTKPSDLVEALVRKGLSPRIGYVLASVLQIIPQMSSAMGKIADAQRSRGMETEGKLLTRVKAFFPLLGPVVMDSLINTRERSMALEVRGFNSSCKKTFLNEEKNYRYNLIINFVLLVSVVCALVWRGVQWLR